MMKKLTLTLGGLVLLASFTSMARADAITFSFLKSNLAVTADSTGLTAGPGVLVSVSDSDTSFVYNLPGQASISTGSAVSYNAAGGTVVALYSAGSGTDHGGFDIVCRRSTSWRLPAGQPEQQRNLCGHEGRDGFISGPFPGGLCQPIHYQSVRRSQSLGADRLRLLEYEPQQFQ